MATSPPGSPLLAGGLRVSVSGGSLGGGSLGGALGGGGPSARGAAAGGPAALLARLLEPRLPALLLTLREMAAALSSASELRGLFDELVGKLVAPLAEVPLDAAAYAALCSALLAPRVVGLLVAGAPHPASAAQQWRRFVAVIGYCVGRIREGTRG